MSGPRFYPPSNRSKVPPKPNIRATATAAEFLRLLHPREHRHGNEPHELWTDDLGSSPSRYHFIDKRIASMDMRISDRISRLGKNKGQATVFHGPLIPMAAKTSRSSTDSQAGSIKTVRQGQMVQFSIDRKPKERASGPKLESLQRPVLLLPAEGRS